MAKYQSTAPTGVSDEDGIFFNETDLMGDKGITLSLFPPDREPLKFFPANSSGDGRIYKGKPVIVTCSLNDVGKKVFRCRGVFKEATKTSTAKICQHMWQEGTSVNIGTLRSHIRSKHWSYSGNATVQISGQKKMSSFFSAKIKKKQRTDGNPGTDTMDMDDSPTPINQDTTSPPNTDNEPVNTSSEEVAADEIEEEVEIESFDHLSNKESPPPIELSPCRGISVLDFKNLNFGDDYDVLEDYPFAIHSIDVRMHFKDANFIPKVDWTIDSSGFVKDMKCSGIISEDCPSVSR